jgi:dimethylaniline monooxygenase (N-oxide forming)
MEACIIGAGFSGIISAKLAVDHGLVPFVLNKNSEPGGVWKGFDGEIGVWDSLHANTSKYLFSFSDQPWNSEDDLFPSCKQVVKYLQDYINKHQLNLYFHNNCEVLELSKAQDDYLIKWKENNQIHQKVFKYVIVATGHCSKEIIPFKEFGDFKGVVVEGGKYREPSVFAGKKVVCLGRGYTSSDIGLEALKSASKVIQICRSPCVIIKQTVEGVPFDFLLYSIKSLNSPTPLIPSLEDLHQLSTSLVNIFGNPSDIIPEWSINTLSSKPTRTVISSIEYLSSVSQRKIEIVQGNLKSFYADGVVLDNGQEVEADVLVSGAGYITQYEFLSQEIKDILQYQGNNPLLSTAMYRSILHPALPRLCFVGNFLSVVPGRFELPAEIGIRYILGELEISTEELWQGVRDEEYIRTLTPNIFEPYTQLGYLYELLRILKIDLNSQLIRTLALEKFPCLPQFFWIERPGQLDTARQAVEDLQNNCQSLFIETIT